jgi:exodeoxyribonuclease V alpha subunit
MDVITGTIETVSRAFSGGWRIASVPPHGTVVGVLPDRMQPGDYCVFKGRWKDHTKYGRQFQVDDARIEIPKDVRGIRDYLDRHFKYVGPSIASRLLEAFGESLFDVMERAPEKLESIPGITRARAEQIHLEYVQIKSDREHDVFFATHGITLGMRNRLVDRFGGKSKAVQAIRENPYALAEAVWGVGFKTADRIALSMGTLKDSPSRLHAGIRYVLKEASQGEGHCYLPADELLSRCQDILGVGEETIKGAINRSMASGHLVAIGSAIYRADILQMEKAVAERVLALASKPHERMMSELSPQIVSRMDPDQRLALNLALSSRILVITGGPGVGKTWTIERIIRALGSAEIRLAAPTGKAAKRMSEMSEHRAQTLHRLLCFHPELGFQRNREDPLDCDTLIIDETSMVDLSLMYHLMEAVKDQQIIFVGDVNQLPSVGPGAVLQDLIGSGKIPVVYLKTLHRQAATSSINVNAQRIVNGHKLVIENEKRDLVFIEEDDQYAIAGKIMAVCQGILQKTGFKTHQLQVLCPQKRGPVGTDDLNEKLRPDLEPRRRKAPGRPVPLGRSRHSDPKQLQSRGLQRGHRQCAPGRSGLPLR